MHTRTTVRSWGAMLLGIGMAGFTGYVLFEDVLHGAAITTSHVTSAATMVATIAAGHLLWPQLRGGNVIAALGLALVFLGGTTYVVTMSGARNAETAAAKMSVAASVNAERSRLVKLRDKAEAMLDEANARLAKECASGKGKKCDGIQATIDVYEAAIKGHDAELRAVGPEKPGNVYAHAAKVFAAIPGVTAKAEEIEGRLELLMPYVLVTVVEVATLTFLGIAFGHRPATAPEKVARSVTPLRKPPSGNPGGPRGRKPGRPSDDRVIDFVDRFRTKHGRPPTGSEIRSEFPQLPKSTAFDHAARARVLTVVRAAA